MNVLQNRVQFPNLNKALQNMSGGDAMVVDGPPAGAPATVTEIGTAGGSDSTSNVNGDSNSKGTGTNPSISIAVPPRAAIPGGRAPIPGGRASIPGGRAPIPGGRDDQGGTTGSSGKASKAPSSPRSPMLRDEKPLDVDESEIEEMLLNSPKRGSKEEHRLRLQVCICTDPFHRS